MLRKISLQRLFARITTLTRHAINPRVQLATLTLLTVLQKSPAIVRVTNGLKTSIEPATRILQKITLAAASLGTTHALSGSSPAAYSVSFNGDASSNLQTFAANIEPTLDNTLAFGLTSVNAGSRNPRSWSVSGQIPQGIVIEGISNGSRVPLNAQNIFNARNGIVSGTPNQSGTFVLELKPWEGANATQRTADALQLTLTITPRELLTPTATIEDQQDRFIITWSITTFQNYQLQSSDNPLDDQSWTPFPAPIETAGEQQTATLEKANVPEGVLIRVASTPK